jgi:hypothetical protein
VQLCDLLKSRLECPDFLEKLECAQTSLPQNIAGRLADRPLFSDFLSSTHNLFLLDFEVQALATFLLRLMIAIFFS